MENRTILTSRITIYMDKSHVLRWPTKSCNWNNKNQQLSDSKYLLFITHFPWKRTRREGPIICDAPTMRLLPLPKVPWFKKGNAFCKFKSSKSGSQLLFYHPLFQKPIAVLTIQVVFRLLCTASPSRSRMFFENSRDAIPHYTPFQQLNSSSADPRRSK